MFDTIKAQTNEHDVEIERIKLEQMKVELQLKEKDAEIIKEITKQLPEYAKVCRANIIPVDGRFTIEIGNTNVKIERYVFSV